MSKSDKMSHAIGNIDDRFLLEAMESCPRRKLHRGVRIFGAVAASICLLVGLAVWGLRGENGFFTVYACESDQQLTIVCKTNIRVAADTQRQEVQTVLEQYFDKLYATMLEESNADYSPNDFASINGYIVAKELVASRYTYHTLLGGIHEVDMKEVTIEELSNQDDHLEAAVYVTCAFSYGDNGETSLGENGETSMGNLYRVTLEKSGEQYKVTDLDCDSITILMAKESILKGKAEGNDADAYRRTDAYFQQIQKNADIMLETQKNF